MPLPNAKQPPAKRPKINNEDETTSVALSLKDLPPEVVLIVFRHVSFPTLCRVKPVCKWWMESVNAGVSIRLGSKAFLTREELVEAVRKLNDDTIGNAEELACTYGWPIGKWDVSLVTDFSEVFMDMKHFNDDIGDWNVSNGRNFDRMFFIAHSFNQDLSKWNTGSATSMAAMFCFAPAFNGNISTWNTENVTDMHNMFVLARSFNQDISSWNTSRVTNMDKMFFQARSFCQDISSWNVTNVISHDWMFHEAESFHDEYYPLFPDEE